MIRTKLMKKGLAKVMALTLAVSMAMPGTVLAAATQTTADETAVEEVYEEEAAEETVAVDEAADEGTALTEEGAESGDAAEEVPADTEDEEVAAAEDEEEPADAETVPANEEEEDPAAAEDEETPADAEDESVIEEENEDGTADDVPADPEAGAPAEEETEAPAEQEDAAAPAAASSDVNKVKSVTIKGGDVTLDLKDHKTYQMDVEVEYDTSTSYAANEPVYFRSDDPDVITVDSTGKVTAVGMGNSYVEVYTVREYYDEEWEEYWEEEETWDSQSFSVAETTYTVKFDLNGGKLADGLKTEDYTAYYLYRDGETVNDGSYVYLTEYFWKDSERIPVAEREGYQFMGWTETKDGEETLDTYYYPTRDITLYASWKKTYTVKFDLNGGKFADGLETASNSTYKMYKDGRTVAEGYGFYIYTTVWINSESVPVLVRDGGYRFAGWTETKDGTTVFDYSYFPTKDITLYAKWIKVYTVTFDANGGTWGDGYYANLCKNGYQGDKDKSIYLPDNDDVTRSGYKLLGWTTVKDGTPALTYSYTITKDITLYAKWAKTYKVTFNAGAGYFGSDKTAKTKVLEIATGKDIGYYLDWSEYTPSNGSQVFLGWYKDSALKTPVKKSDTISKDITYYAKYETKSYYKITVTNLKGATYENRATGTYIYGDKSTAESYSFNLSQGDEIGYLSASKDGESARFFFDQDCKTKPYYSSYVPTGNTTVYAKWDSKVTITWDAAGGKDWNGKSTGTVSCKKNLMCENLPTELTKEGYYFVGWYDAADSAKKVLPASHVFKANTTVKAKWATGIKITFKSNGGTFSSGGDTAVVYIKAKTYLGEFMNFSVKRTGYTLTGWKSSATGKAVSSIYDEKPAKATTYTAIWTKDGDTVNVTLMAGDGSLYDWENDKYVTKLVVKVPKNATLANARLSYSLEHDEPYKGLRVSGWSLTKTGSAIESSYKFTKDVTLYPIWNKNSTRLAVALVTNGGAINNYPDNDPQIYRVEKDATIKLPNATNMEKEGFTFLGWYTDPSFKTKVSTPDAYKVTKSCYLYAKWKQGAPSALGKTTRGDMFNLANNVKVTWQAVPGAKYYKVYREGVTNKSETQKDPVIVTTGLVGWDSSPGLTNGHAYRYRIVASTTGKGDSSGDSSQSYSKLMYRLKTVVIRSVKNTAAGEVTVTYDKTTSGDSYVLQYCERQDMVGAKTKVVLGANNTSYKIGGLKKGKTYYISIRVRKKVDGIDYYTTFGVAKKITITK